MRADIERLYCHFAEGADATSEGRKQFEQFDSRGISPVSPDPYYLRLCQGKKWFQWQQTEYRKAYMQAEWIGWELIWRDWQDAAWVLPYLFAGWNRVPKWLLNGEGPTPKPPEENPCWTATADLAEPSLLAPWKWMPWVEPAGCI